jgi:H+-translocating NAD(P) transhydrogenase subunit alpha
MKIAVMKETHTGEMRVPIIPPSAEKLVKLGAEVEIEVGLGLNCRFADADYEKAGAKVSSSREDLLRSADIILRLRKPPHEEVELMKKGCIHISYLDPFNEPELVDGLVTAGISGVSLEMIPRTTLAQKMDVLSSQANLAGYVSVLLGTPISRQDLADDDHPGRNDQAGQGLHHRRRCCRPAGHCHGQASRGPGRGF